MQGVADNYISLSQEALFEFWYRHADTLGYKPIDFEAMRDILRVGQETWIKHVAYRQAHSMDVLSEIEFLRYFILNLESSPIAATGV